MISIAWVSWSHLVNGKKSSPISEPAVAVALDWNKHVLVADRFTEGFRAPVSARAEAYIGLAAWEAALPGLPNGYRSLGERFPDLQLPKAEAADYHLPSILNACYSTIILKLFSMTPPTVEHQRVELEKRWLASFAGKIDPGTLRRSEDFGKKVALAVYEWSASDSLGHMANLHNFDRNYTQPVGDGFWQPCIDFPTPSLLPYWGETRTFMIQTEDWLASPLPAFSTEPNSVYYRQAMEVLTLNSPLSAENQWIAEFWSDDHPGLTFSPASRWICIANQVIEKEAPPAAKALETYLRLGFAMSDAMVSCWHSKYYYNLLRPETFIQTWIQPDWRPIAHTPPFPSYPSGHAIVSAAAAEVLTQLYGENYKMTDRSHEGRTELKGTPRSFRSFHEMAFEGAFSRIPLGAHFRIDCEEGTRQGLLIGKEVIKLTLTEPVR